MQNYNPDSKQVPLLNSNNNFQEFDKQNVQIELREVNSTPRKNEDDQIIDLNRQSSTFSNGGRQGSASPANNSLQSSTQKEPLVSDEQQETSQNNNQNNFLQNLKQQDILQPEKKTHKFIVYILSTLYDFEEKMKNFAWVYYVVFCVSLTTLLLTISKGIDDRIPLIEIVSVTFLVCFIINYSLIRIGNLLPYIEDEDGNYVAKKAGFFGLFSLISLIYFMQTPARQIGLVIWFSSFFFSTLIELFYFKLKINWTEKMYSVLILFGSLLILRPGHVNENQFYKQVNKYISKNSTNSTITKNISMPTNALVSSSDIITNYNDYQRQFYYGIGAAIFSSFCLGYAVTAWKQLRQANSLTLLNIFGLIMLIFLPIFFPMQKIITPSPTIWIFLIIFGFFMEVVMLLIIRSIQLEKPSVILVYFNVCFVLKILIDLMLARSSFYLFDYIGCTFIVVSGVQLAKTSAEHKIQQLKLQWSDAKHEDIVDTSLYYVGGGQGMPGLQKQEVESDLAKYISKAQKLKENKKQADFEQKEQELVDFINQEKLKQQQQQRINSESSQQK